MTTFRRILTFAALSVLAGGIASANSIGCAYAGFLVTDSGECFEASAPLNTITWGPTSLNINQFDPTLGTLNYVEIIAWSSGDATLSVSNRNQTTTESFTGGFADISMSFSGTGFSTMSLTGGLTGVANSVAGGGLYTSASTPFSTDNTATPTFLQNTIPFPNTLTPFIGTGTIGSLTATGGPSSASGTGGTDLFYNASGDVGGTIAILYDYTPKPSGVPEPTTMALMGGALFGLGLVGKKRFKKS